MLLLVVILLKKVGSSFQHGNQITIYNTKVTMYNWTLTNMPTSVAGERTFAFFLYFIWHIIREWEIMRLL